MRSFLAFILILSCAVARANGEPQEDVRVKIANWALDKALGMVPGGDKACLKQKVLPLYGVQTDLSGENKGLVGYFSKLAKDNQCFGDIARDFYRDIRQVKERGAIGIPRLSEKTKRPGWLWEEAMKASHQNPNLAIRLIGMCGHDYALQGKLEISQGLTEMDLTIQDRKFEMRLFQGPLRDQVAADIERLEALRERVALGEIHKGALACPDAPTDFYLPGSLGASVDLSDEHKKQIANSQTGGDMNAPPAKYYHVYASSMLGCAMSECGVSPKLASTIQSLIVSGYRAHRLCSETGRSMKDFARRLGLAGIDLSSPNIVDLIVRAAKGKSFESCKDPLCYRLAEISHYADDPEVQKAKIKNMIGRIDAFQLYEKWYLGGKTGGMDLPCSHVRIGGPSSFDDVILNPFGVPESLLKRMSRTPPPTNCAGILTDSSYERCAAALRRLKTWDTDFNWTSEQHRIGAEFGAKNCGGGDRDFIKAAERVCAARNSYKDFENPRAPVLTGDAEGSR